MAARSHIVLCAPCVCVCVCCAYLAHCFHKSTQWCMCLLRVRRCSYRPLFGSYAHHQLLIFIFSWHTYFAPQFYFHFGYRRAPVAHKWWKWTKWRRTRRARRIVDGRCWSCGQTERVTHFVTLQWAAVSQNDLYKVDLSVGISIREKSSKFDFRPREREGESLGHQKYWHIRWLPKAHLPGGNWPRSLVGIGQEHKIAGETGQDQAN